MKKSKRSNKSANLNTPFNIKSHSQVIPNASPPDDLYKWFTDKNHFEFLKYIFDHHQWSRFYKATRQPSQRQYMRIIVQIGTIDACLRGKYFLLDGTSVQLNKKELYAASRTSKMYNSDFVFRDPRPLLLKPPKTSPRSSLSSSSTTTAAATTSTTTTTTSSTITTPPSDTVPDKTSVAPGSETNSQDQTETQYMVIEGDCLEAAIWLKNTRQCNPVVLNMASRSLPGGGYRSGAAAQEENLHRRTNLFQCLEDAYQVDASRDWSYPLPEFGGVYTKDACVLRRCEALGYEYLPVPEKMSFVAVSAYSNPPTETRASSGELVLSKKIAQHTLHKIHTILNIALENGHDSIVLSAFGCGVYLNPAGHVSELFKEALSSKFKNCFRFVVFAIINSKNAINPEGSLKSFARTFRTDPVDLLSDLLQIHQERDDVHGDAEAEDSEAEGDSALDEGPDDDGDDK